MTDASTVSLAKARGAKSFTVPKAVATNGWSCEAAGIATKAFAKASRCKAVAVK